MKYDIIDRLTGYVYKKDLTKAEAIKNAKEIMVINGYKETAYKDMLRIEKQITSGQLQLMKNLGFTKKEIESIKYSSQFERLLQQAIETL